MIKQILLSIDWKHLFLSKTNAGGVILAVLLYAGPEPDISLLAYGETYKIGDIVVSLALLLLFGGRFLAKGPFMKDYSHIFTLLQSKENNKTAGGEDNGWEGASKR